MKKSKIIEWVKADQRAWMSLYQLARARLIASDALVKNLEKKEKPKKEKT